MIEIKTIEISGMASVLQALRLPTIQPIIYEVDNKVIVRNLDRRIGVYLILINGKKYVGSTSAAKGVSERLNQHRWHLKANTHKNRHLQRAYNKYKEFYGFFIEETLEKVTLEREQHYINLLSPEYNICKEACSSAKGVVRTEETKQKLSEAMRGRKFSEETLKLMSDSHKGYVMPQSQKEKIRIANTGRKMTPQNVMRLSKPIDMYSMGGEYIKTFPSISEASRQLNICANPIQRCAVGKIISAYNHIWRHKGDAFDLYRTKKYSKLNSNGKRVAINSDGVVKVYGSINEVSRLFGIDRSVIRRLLSSGRKYAGGITKLKNSTFEYVRD